MTTHDHTPDDLRLSSDERQEMRAQMRGFMAAHPVRVRAPFFSPRFLRLATPVAAFVVLCTGTTFAAEQALPNDVLYPVKVGVIEPLVGGALSYSPTSEARVNGMLAERRLQETETLIARDELDPETATSLQASIVRHADAVQASLQEAVAQGDTVDAVRASTDIQARLDAHNAVLEDLADEAPEADAISDAVAAQATRAGQAGDAIEERLDDVPAQQEDMLAYDTMNEGQAAIAQAQDALDGAPAGTDLTGEASDLVSQARQAFAAGTGQLNGGDDTAGESFRDALRLARQARIVLDSQDDVTGR